MAGKSTPQNVVQTSNSSPWPQQQPYLLEVFNKAQDWYQSDSPQYYPNPTVVGQSQATLDALSAAEMRARQGSPVQDAAQNSLQQTLSGGFLNQNPALQGAMDAALSGLNRNYTQHVMPGLQAAYSAAGRYGSGAMQNAVSESQQNYLEQAGNVASGMAYQNYGDERNRMLTGLQMAPSVAGMDYTDIQALQNVGAAREQFQQDLMGADIERHNFEENKDINKLAQYMGLIGGSYGGSMTQTTPYFRNTGAQIAGAAAGGLGALGSILSLL